jgi:hypothetical protein
VSRLATTILAATLTLTAAAAHAQQCKPTDTVLACWMRFNPAAGSDVPGNTPVESATQATVTAANTGVSSLVSPSGSAVKDFMSLFSASIESASLTSSGQALTLDYNPPFDILGTDHALKLQATFNKPQLNNQLTAQFASNPAGLTPFTNSLANTDDVAISGTFQPTSERFGRSIVPNRPFFRQMVNSIAPDRFRWQMALANAIASTPLVETQTFASLPADRQESAMTAIESAAKSQQTFLRGIGTLADAFARLLNNQPQLYASAVYDARRNVVGPNEWAVKGTYELSTHNLNTFRRRNAAACSATALADAKAAAQCAALLETFADAGAYDRLVMSVEYHRTNQRYIAGDPNLAGFTFGYPRAHSFGYQLTYGRPMQGAVTGTTNGRIDVSFRYDDVRNPANSSLNVQSQATGSVTYTQKINDSFSLPISLIFANHASDVTNVNKKLNAHFGLVYKLTPNK